ncbi:MAG: cytochrome c3 family protein [Burkholderiales bacterium]
MANAKGRRVWWIVWGLSSVLIGGYLAAGIFAKDAATMPWLAPARTLFLPGQTSHGHYQIELKCEACHKSAFGGQESLQEACVGCHGAELKAADDKHPLTKFTDPRNAERVEKLDATLCVTCHSEHRPRITQAMGVTQPADFCFHCHGGDNDIRVDRPSHKGMAFDTCGTSGCHKFHDNRALYEDFLAKHLNEAAVNAAGRLPRRSLREAAATFPDYPVQRFPLKAQTVPDAPAGFRQPAGVAADWLATSHAAAGVNCSGCHQETDKQGVATWAERPDQRVCATCHETETKGFLAGKHGMRLAAGLTPMTPGQARLPMQGKSHAIALGCNTCHTAHKFDTHEAAVDGCLQCHRDDHTLAYKQSRHYALWKQELAGTLPAGSGVSCASCHLPRVEHRRDGSTRTLVQHNQNDTLRPSEKMIRPVCMNCHGLGYAIDALADPALVKRNFQGAPGGHVRSLEMVMERARQLDEKRRAERAAAAGK